MSVNVGTLDRVLRFVVGLVLVIAPFATNMALFQGTTAMAISIVIGAVLVLTAAFRSCPLYSLLGMRTCRS
jgi:uncharacterized membrane protein